ncbi:V-type proton ATPase subunit H-like [Schistocerca gregaria]|uniref:V-type proton ATPase subunit H-like n=1 Tax=Schistocerca gregaria TaxID=7010 RepID=UPI00211DE35C|nr:V-type proton ATPase subunit H-like [Schistocerca gregaria]
MFTRKHSHGNTEEKQSCFDYEQLSGKGIISTKDVMSVGIDWNYLSSTDKEYTATLQKFNGPNVNYADLVAKLKKKWATAFFSFLSMVRSVNYLRFLLALLHKTFKESPLAVKYCQELYQDKKQELPFVPLVSLLLEDQDAYVSYKTCMIYTTLLLGMENIDNSDAKFLLTWLRDKIAYSNEKSKLKNSDPAKNFDPTKNPDSTKNSDSTGLPQKLAMTFLQKILTVSKYRFIFWEQGGLEALTVYVHLHTEDFKNTQLLYEVMHCLWLMSFKEKIRWTFTDPVLISDLIEILKHVSKDKVIRLTLATLCNILNVGQNNQMMISYGIMRCIDIFSTKKWSDEDISESLETLKVTLEKEVVNLSSFDVYKNEVLGLKLDMSSPIHKSPTFWHSNISRFDENNYFIIRKLIEILRDPNVSSKVLAVACWDVGEIIRFHPQRNFVLKQIDLKSPVILLIDHPDAEVKKEALLALQKFMIINWELLAQD